MGDSALEATWSSGARAVSPILLGIAPFGLIFGAVAASSDVPLLAAWASSFIIFAGASQIAIVEVLGGGGAPLVAILTAIVINARMLMYSADISRYTAQMPLRTKLFVGYLLTDQAYLVTAQKFPSPQNASSFLPFYFGAGLTLWTTWQISTTTGFLIGAAIPPAWSLEFAIPLSFMALLVLAVKDKPGMLAAVVGGTVAVFALPLPYHLGLLVGATCGIVAGMVSERWFQ